MATFKVQVLVRLKPGVLDVQGKAIEQGLHTALGERDVSSVRVGKLIELEIGAENSSILRDRVAGLCQALLVNSVMESYEIKIFD